MFVSSHLMSEMELTADHLVVIGQGHILADVPMAELLERSSRTHVSVVSPEALRLTALLTTSPDITITRRAIDEIDVTGLPAATIGDLACRNGVPLHSLHTVAASLEEAYMELTHDSVGYRASLPQTATLEGAAR